ncbi:MAG: nucleotidyltransferase family protein [Pseudomonadota bacterium]
MQGLSSSAARGIAEGRENLHDFLSDAQGFGAGVPEGASAMGMIEPTPAHHDDVLAASMSESLLPAALAEADAPFTDAWARWRAGKDRIERLAGVDYKLLPQVWPRVEELGIQDPLARVFRGTRKRVWTRNRLLLSEAEKVQRRLEDAGIASVLMKGPSLLAGAYPSIGDRPTADIDILVDPMDFRNATRCLRAGRDAVSCDAHATSLKGPGLVAIDLHRYASQLSVAQGATAALEREVLSRRRTEKVGKLTLTIPEPTELLFLHLLNVFAHGARLTAQSALWLADARACITAGGIDKARLTELVDAHGAAPLFQHHFRAFRPFAPQMLHPMMDMVLGMQLHEGARRVALVLDDLEARHRRAKPDDPFRAQWFALRGQKEAGAPSRLRVRYVLECAANVARAITLSPRMIGRVISTSGYYFRRTVDAMRR